MFEKLKNIDRRVIFFITALSVVIPMLFPIGSVPQITEHPLKMYEMIENLKEGDRVLFSFDYDPASMPEIHPGALALIRHAVLKKKVKPIIMALWPMGSNLSDEVLERVIEEYRDLYRDLIAQDPDKYNLVYGRDYVNLGYKVGGLITIQLLSNKGFLDTFILDKKGNETSELPIMKDLDSITKVKAIVSFSSGTPGLKEWVKVVNAQHNIPTCGAVTAVSAPEYYPYYNSGQLTGILGGLKGSSEFEQLSILGMKKHIQDIKPVLTKAMNENAAKNGRKVDTEKEINRLTKYFSTPGMAIRGMDVQSVTHLVIILFIILANISYFAERRNNRES